MKKMKSIIFKVLVAFALMCPAPAFAAGSVTQSLAHVSSGIFMLTFSWTGDAVNGTVPATTSASAIDGFVFMVATNPGSTAPTDNYGITLTDSDGIDISGGELADRDTANSEDAPMESDSNVLQNGRFVAGHLILTITGQSVVSATGTVTVYYKK